MTRDRMFELFEEGYTFVEIVDARKWATCDWELADLEEATIIDYNINENTQVIEILRWEEC